MEKQSIKQVVYNTLKESILNRKLPPGNQLVENTISSRLNVSRTPIRSAINQLATEGLVEIIPNKGAYVINPTIDEIIQAYNLRKDLEIMAIEKSINSFNQDDFLEMETIIKEEKEAIFNTDVSWYLKANQNFHMAIAKKSGNKFLVEFIEKLIQQTSIYLILFDIFLEESSPQPYGYKEHLEIIELLKQKDLTQLRECFHNHFDHAVNSLDVRKEYRGLDGLFK
ncbi:GntR family transcriptional regulator [Virgibacillus byunsanensis]|uniref:GntR family transcriptional regulator n=1 Tax=Virgibacillus byunsanensis TaxID=570945 RepID=A0ABW3LFV6_9BACI